MTKKPEEGVVVRAEEEVLALDVVPKFAHAVNHAEGLELVDGVLLLGQVEFFRPIGDRSFAALIVKLSKDPSHREDRRIRHDDELPGVVGVDEDGVAGERGLVRVATAARCWSVQTHSAPDLRNSLSG